MRRCFPFVALMAVLAMESGCRRTLGSPTPLPPGWDRGSAVLEMEPIRIDLKRTDSGSGYTATMTEAEPLFEAALTAMESANLSSAATLFERVAIEFEDSRFALAARYNAGLMLEAMGDFALGSAHYELAARVRPGTPDAADALFRLGHCLGRLSEWERVRAIFTDLLASYELNATDTVEARSRLAVALLHLDDLEAAEREARATIEFHAARERVERLEHSYFIAQAHFYLGEALRARSSRVALEATDKATLARDLEARSRLLLEARHAYLVTVSKNNLHWASAAGLRLGQLFEEYRRAILDAPYPPELDTTEKRETYRALLSDELDPVIYRARTVYRSTLDMAARTGVRNRWIEDVREHLESLEEWMIVAGWLGVPMADTTAKTAIAEVAIRNDTGATVKISLVGFVRDARIGAFKRIAPVAELPPGGERMLTVRPARYAFEIHWSDAAPAGDEADAAVFSGAQYFHARYVYRAILVKKTPAGSDRALPTPYFEGAPELPSPTPATRPGLSFVPSVRVPRDG